MRRLTCVLSFALLLVGCSRGSNESTETTAAAPTSISSAGSTLPAELASLDPQAAEAQRELDFTKELARLSDAGNQHEQRGYFDHAVDARRQTLALLQDRYGASAWQTRSAQVALAHAERVQKLAPQQQAMYRDSMRAESTANEQWNAKQPESALVELNHARTIATQLWGPADYTVANLLDRESQWRQTMGQFESAEALSRQALAIREPLFTRDHPDTIASISRLGLILQVEKRYDDAALLLREATTRSENVWGTSTADYARHLNNLGMLEYDRGNSSAAIEALSKSLAIRQQCLAADDPLVAHSLFNLGSAYYAAQDYAAATPRLREALDLFRPRLGDSHRITRLARANLAMSMMAEKKYAEAEATLREDYDAARRTFGDKSPLVAECLLRLGVLYGNQARYVEAEPLLSRAAEIDRAELGSEHASTRQAETLLSQVRAKLARPS